MPETSMYENNCIVFWKADIRFARQLFIMKPESITHAMQDTSNDNLRFGILRPDR